jgi:hypothetical protein
MTVKLGEGGDDEATMFWAYLAMSVLIVGGAAAGFVYGAWMAFQTMAENVK